MEISQHVPAAPMDLLLQSWQATGGEFIAQMELEFDRRLDVHLLKHAADLLLEAEPILNSKLVIDTPVPYWQRLSEEKRNLLIVADTSNVYETFRHSGLDATQGAQVALCLWRCEAGDRLLIKMTHQVGDGGGMHAVTERLSSIYSALHTDPRYRPEPTRETNRDVMELLPRVPWCPIIWDFVRFMAPRWFPRRTLMLPLPHESIGPWHFVERRLAASRVFFLSTYGRERGATLNDMFLAATYRALASLGAWDETSGLRILITVDLRRYLPSDSCADHISNLSTMDCPYLVRNLGRSFEETLANVRSLMHRRKENWPGLAVVWFTYLGMTLERYDRRVRPAGKRNNKMGFPKLTLSNTGPIDKARVAFAGRPPVSACILPPFRKLPGLLMCLSGYDGTLTLSAGTPQNGHSMVGSFFDALIGELPLGELEPMEARQVSAT